MTDDNADTTPDVLTDQSDMSSDNLATKTSEESTTDNEGDGLYPIDSKWLVLGFYVIVLAWVVYLLFQTRGWVYEDRLLPRLFGPPVIVLALIQIVKILFPDLIDRLVPDSGDSKTFTIDTDNTTRTKREKQKYELIMIGWVIVLPVMLYYLGFVITLPLYTLLFLLYFLSSPARAVIITAAVSIAMYLLFSELLGLRLYPGAWELLSLIYLSHL